MFYTPHKLQIYKTGKPTFDDDGIPIPGKGEWIYFADCRCDDNGAMKQIGVNGEVRIYSYHIVYEGEKLPIGTKVRATKEDGSTRGDGIVIKPGECNLLGYSEIWV